MVRGDSCVLGYMLFISIICLQLTTVGLPAVSDYLTQNGTNYESGRKLYNAGFVVYLRGSTASQDGCVFLRGQCAAEMCKLRCSIYSRDLVQSIPGPTAQCLMCTTPLRQFLLMCMQLYFIVP